MAPTSSRLSFGYYGFVALVLGLVMVLVGMRPGPRDSLDEGVPQGTNLATMVGQGLSVAGSLSIAGWAWVHQRERRRLAETAQADGANADSNGRIG